MLLLGKGLKSEASAILLPTVFYFRPGELLRILVRNVIPPLARAGPLRAYWSITLHKFVNEESRGSKTKEYDESLLLDLPQHQFLGPVLADLISNRRGGEPLFKFDQGHLTRCFRMVTDELGVKPQPMLYQLRHSGASMDYINRARDLLGIKRRGRWRADSSLRRYEKGGRLTEQLRKLAPRVRGFCVRSAGRLPAVLCSRLAPSRFHVV